MFRLTRSLLASCSVISSVALWCCQNGGASFVTTMAYADVLSPTFVRTNGYRRKFCALKQCERVTAFVNQKTVVRRKECRTDSSRAMILNHLDPLGRDVPPMDVSFENEVRDHSFTLQVPHHQESNWTSASSSDEAIRIDNFGTTWAQFMEEQKRMNPECTALVPLLNSIAMACRIISIDLIHRAPFIASSVETLCSQVMQQALLYTGQCQVETTSPSSLRVEALEVNGAPKLVAFITPLMVDASWSPDDMLLCGSGTLFSIHRCNGNASSSLDPSPLVSGYCLYGSATKLVVTTTTSVQGFTLNIHNQNDFVCTHPKMSVPTNATVDRTIPESVLQRIAAATGHFYRRPLGTNDWIEQPWIRGIDHLHRALSATGGILSVPPMHREQIHAIAWLWERAGGAMVCVASSDGRCYRSITELPSPQEDTVPFRACYFGNDSDIEQLQSYVRIQAASVV